ncbi:MAG: hypothetical protein ACOWWR_05990 [Eubacteriales bacterium]
MKVFVVILTMFSYEIRLVIFSLDFTLLRLFIVFSFLRILIRNEYYIKKLIPLDYVLLFYFLSSGILYSLLWSFNTSSIVFQLGRLLDLIGSYYILRNYLTSIEDYILIIKYFAIVSVVIAPLFVFEYITGLNIFGLLINGNLTVSEIRENRVRAKGAFPHPILAGSFWAVLFPVILSLKNYLRKRKEKALINISIVSILIIVFTCSSTTPIIALAAGFFFYLLYYLRNEYKRIKYSIIFLLFSLQLYMDNPIWYLLMKIDISGGSTGFFRYLLFDRFVSNWKEWLFVGIRDTYHWGESYDLPSIGLRDLTNRFVYEGVNGGIIRLIMFTVIIIMAFLYCESLIKVKDKEKSAVMWGIFGSLVVNFVNFWGVNYFGQVEIILWFTILAIITSYAQFRDI